MTDMLNPQMTGGSLSERVAEEIRALLGRRRMSQAELARRLDTSGAWLNYRLTGRQPIDLDDLERIADALGVSPSDLITATGTATIREPTSRRRDRRGRREDPPLAAVSPIGARPSNARTSTGRPPSYPTKGRRPVILAQPAA